MQSWMLDPDAAPHGGESLALFSTRIARWLDDQAAQDGRVTVITHGEVVKAAVVHALGAPLARVLAHRRDAAGDHGATRAWRALDVVRLNCA